MVILPQGCWPFTSFVEKKCKVWCFICPSLLVEFSFKFWKERGAGVLPVQHGQWYFPCLASNTRSSFKLWPYHTMSYHTIPYHTIPNVPGYTTHTILNLKPTNSGHSRIWALLKSFSETAWPLVVGVRQSRKFQWSLKLIANILQNFSALQWRLKTFVVGKWGKTLDLRRTLLVANLMDYSIIYTTLGPRTWNMQTFRHKDFRILPQFTQYSIHIQDQQIL